VAEPKEMLSNFWDWVLNVEKLKRSSGEEWDGSIPNEATSFLFQFGLQNGISEETHVSFTGTF